MRAELANLNHCAVPFLSRAAVKLSWYDSSLLTHNIVSTILKTNPSTKSDAPYFFKLLRNS